MGTSVIKGVTKHSANQAVERGFKTPDILKIVREGTPVEAMGIYGAQTRYTLGGNTVVVNSHFAFFQQIIYSNIQNISQLFDGFDEHSGLGECVRLAMPSKPPVSMTGRWSLSTIACPERSLGKDGRITRSGSTYTYHYFLTDSRSRRDRHLGNNRVGFAQGTNVTAPNFTADYYPFGLQYRQPR